jgi:hypothetical protein
MTTKPRRQGLLGLYMLLGTIPVFLTINRTNNAYYVNIHNSIAIIFPNKPCTPVGFEPGSDRCDDHCATPLHVRTELKCSKTLHMYVGTILNVSL